MYLVTYKNMSQKTVDRQTVLQLIKDNAIICYKKTA